MKHDVKIAPVLVMVKWWQWHCLTCQELGTPQGHRGRVNVAGLNHARRVSPDCQADGCAKPRRKQGGRWCEAHAKRVRVYGRPLAHVPLGSTNDLGAHLAAPEPKRRPAKLPRQRPRQFFDLEDTGEL